MTDDKFIPCRDCPSHKAMVTQRDCNETHRTTLQAKVFYTVIGIAVICFGTLFAGLISGAQDIAVSKHNQEMLAITIEKIQESQQRSHEAQQKILSRLEKIITTIDFRYEIVIEQITEIKGQGERNKTHINDLEDRERERFGNPHN